MVVMDNDGKIFDERRKMKRRKNDRERRDIEKNVILDRREDVKDRRVGQDRRKKNINE